MNNHDEEQPRFVGGPLDGQVADVQRPRPAYLDEEGRPVHRGGPARARTAAYAAQVDEDDHPVYAYRGLRTH